MKQNMGLLDRVIRIALAASVAVLYAAGLLTPVASVVLGILAVVFLATGFVGVCPLYMLLGISTRRRRAS